MDVWTADKFSCDVFSTRWPDGFLRHQNPPTKPEIRGKPMSLTPSPQPEALPVVVEDDELATGMPVWLIGIEYVGVSVGVVGAATSNPGAVPTFDPVT